MDLNGGITMRRITVTLDKSKKYLDRQRLIEDNNGVKRPIDGFYVKDINGKSSVNIVYFIANLDVVLLGLMLVLLL